MSVGRRVVRDEQVHPAVAQLRRRRPQLVQEAGVGGRRRTTPVDGGGSDEEMHHRTGFAEEHGSLESGLTPSYDGDGLVAESGQIMVIAGVADAPGRPLGVALPRRELGRHISERCRADREDNRCRGDLLAGGEFDLESGRGTSDAGDLVLFERRYLSPLEPPAVLDKVGDRDRGFATVQVVWLNAGVCAPDAYARLRIAATRCSSPERLT